MTNLSPSDPWRLVAAFFGGLTGFLFVAWLMIIWADNYDKRAVMRTPSDAELFEECYQYRVRDSNATTTPAPEYRQ